MPVQKVEGRDQLRRVESSNVLGKFAEPRQVKEELAAGTVLQHNEQLLFGLACRRSKQGLRGAGDRENFHVAYRWIREGGSVWNILVITYDNMCPRSLTWKA